MTIDNSVYDRIGSGWWDADNPLNMLQGSMTPARFEYFSNVMRDHGRSPKGLRGLDIGCGGGFMSERFARAGVDVVGVDPSEVSLTTARGHAEAAGLPIDYRTGVGEKLPVQDREFDIALCCDVFEHVDDVDTVLAEAARALKPGGLYFFDTINRTCLANLLMIKVLQDWRFTRIFDTPVHNPAMFITPTELSKSLRCNSFVVGEIVGLSPRRMDPRVAVDFLRTRSGRLSFGEFSNRLNFGRSRITATSYMGYAVRIAD